MRGTSILPEAYCEEIRKDPRIASAAAVLMFISSIELDGQSATVLLTGYVPETMGGPPSITEGRLIKGDGEIVLDRAFATKYSIALNQRLRIRDDSLTVVGFSAGTNAFVTQYAFVTLAYEQSIVELPGLASFFIVALKQGNNREAVMRDIDAKYPGRLSVYSHEQFLENNIREIEAGILPLFYAIALIGGVVLSIILSLILSVNILERRNDFAVMKIIGSPIGYLRRMVVTQSLLIACVSECFGLLLLYPMLEMIETITPEVAAVITPTHVLMITAVSIIISIISGLLASRRVRRISPSEVFA
jgi:putative ABC transport system permease protein